MTFDVIKKRIGNFLSGWALNGRQKTLLGSASQRLRFPYLLPLPAVSSPLFSLALTPSTNVEQIIWGDQKIWSGKLAAQKLIRDNDLRLYYGLKLMISTISVMTLRFAIVLFQCDALICYLVLVLWHYAITFDYYAFTMCWFVTVPWRSAVTLCYFAIVF